MEYKKSNSEIQKEVEKIITTLEERVKSHTFNLNNLFIAQNIGPNRAGLYLIFTKELCYKYTGITRNLKVRLTDHIGLDPANATFNKKLSKGKSDLIEVDKLRNYTGKIESKAVLDKFPDMSKKEYDKLLKEKMKETQNYIKSLYFTYVIIDNDDLLMHALEPFVANHFKCKWNDFRTN